MNNLEINAPASPWWTRAADLGGMFNAGLCVLHCAAGPLLLAWLGTHGRWLAAEAWDLAFLLMSAGMVLLATRRPAAGRFRGVFGGFLLVFGAAALLADRWPWLEWVQYAASAGLIATHFLNHRHCRECATAAAVRAAQAPATARQELAVKGL